MNNHRKHIIVVDDDAAIQDIISLVLKADLYDLTILTNGEELMQQDHLIPDLYILDKQLSGADGLRLCRHLKAREETKNIPVIMLSASPTIATLAREAGADGWIEKPFKIKELRAITEKLLA